MNPNSNPKLKLKLKLKFNRILVAVVTISTLGVGSITLADPILYFYIIVDLGDMWGVSSPGSRPLQLESFSSYVKHVFASTTFFHFLTTFMLLALCFYSIYLFKYLRN